MDSVIRWGVVGTGAISRQMASDFALVDGAEIGAVSSRSPEHADAFAEEFRIAERFTNLDEFWASDIDAVYIGTPHVTHFGMVKAAIAAGKHVLCEKPLAMDAAQVRELTRLASAEGVFLLEAMWMKFTPLTRHLVDLVRSGDLGEVTSVQARFGAPFPRDNSSRWLPGGSTLLDQGIYPITLAHLMLGMPGHIDARGTVRDDGVDLRSHFTLEYSADRFAQGACSQVEWLDETASVSGTAGSAHLGEGFWYSSRLAVTRSGTDFGRSEIVEFEREGFGYVPMLRAANEAIRAGLLEHPLHPAKDVIDVFEIMDEIRRRISRRAEAHS